MTTRELIDELERIIKVHPHVDGLVVQTRDKSGDIGNNSYVRIRKSTILIETD